MEILPVGADAFHEGGRTEGHRDTDRQTVRQTGLQKLIVVFRNFSKARGLYWHDICSSRL